MQRDSVHQEDLTAPNTYTPNTRNAKCIMGKSISSSEIAAPHSIANETIKKKIDKDVEDLQSVTNPVDLIVVCRTLHPTVQNACSFKGTWDIYQEGPGLPKFQRIPSY